MKKHKKKDIWTVSHEDSSVCFQYGSEGEAIFQGNFQHFSGMMLADEHLKAFDLMLYVESETIKATEPSQNALFYCYPVLTSMPNNTRY